MGLFSFLKSLTKEKNENNYPSNLSRTEVRNNFIDTMNEIESNKYLNDDKTKELYKKAYKQTEDNLIDRHFYYNNVIDYYYGLRDKQQDALEKCIEYCKADIEISSQVLDLMKRDKMWKHYNQEGELVFTPPRFPSFQRLAIILEKQGRYDEAVKICNKAIELNLRDGTKTGFEGRISRLKKKIRKK